MDYVSISKQALGRMPYYLEELRKLHENGIENVSAPALAHNINISDIQVRKDLAAVSTEKGKPKAGFSVQNLMENIEWLLGYDNVTEAVIAGIGNFGRALLSYDGFEKEGMKIVAAFDVDPWLIGSRLNGIEIFSADRIPEIAERLGTHLGIICAPAGSAQGICDAMIKGGIKAILNLTSANLQVPKNVLVDNMSIASSLAILSHHLKRGE